MEVEKMDEMLRSQPPRETPADDAALFARYLEEVQHLNGQMRKDQTEIARLKIETLVHDAEMHRLTEESRVLQTEIRKSLARLQAA
jgi:hypothetical protein